MYPINPKHKKVGGLKCYPRVLDIGEEVDLALIATPARTVPGIIRDLGEAGCKNAIILSAGFGEGGGDGKEYESRADRPGEPGAACGSWGRTASAWCGRGTR